MEGKNKPKQSRLGIVSVILSLLFPILYYLAIQIYISYKNISSYELIIFQYPTVCFPIIISVIALILGVIGLVEKNKNRFYAILGIVISMLFITAEMYIIFAHVLHIIQDLFS